MQQSIDIIKPMTRDEAVEWEGELGRAASRLQVVLDEGYRREAWRILGYSSWTEHLKVLADRFGFAERHIYRLHSANQTEKILTQGHIDNDYTQVGQIPERHIRPLTKLETPEQKREAWKRANETAPNGKITGAHVEKTVEEYRQEIKVQSKQAAYITVDTWQAFDDIAKQDVIEAAKHETGAQFNRTNDNVEWALWTWNPITGCLHNCPYCYARDIANRFYEQKFAPSFIPSRLTAPANTKSPDLSQVTDPVMRVGLQNVFVCSMADLFGKWVPVEWIEAVLEQVKNNPQWNFLFLTKFPIRMSEFEYPANAWLGTSVDHQWAVERAEKAFRKLQTTGYQGIAWLSCEPMMERLTFTSLDMFDWVVMGGASRSSQTPEYRPPFEDIVHLHNQARESGCKVYQKTNLIPGMGNEQRIREYPW